MSRPDLEARAEAVAALGRGAERTLDKLTSAGLVVVRLADVQATPSRFRTFMQVSLEMPEGLPEPYRVKVITSELDGPTTLNLRAALDAVPQILEAQALARLMGHRLDIEVDEAEGLLMRAIAVER